MSKIGLVLSGGFAKGAYQIGILKALDEFVAYDNINRHFIKNVVKNLAYPQ